MRTILMSDAYCLASLSVSAAITERASIARGGLRCVASKHLWYVASASPIVAASLLRNWAKTYGIPRLAACSALDVVVPSKNISAGWGGTGLTRKPYGGGF